MKVEFHQLLDVAKNVLIQMGVRDYKEVELTYVLKVGNEWRVNFSYFKGNSIYKTVSCFAVDAETGEIRGIWTTRAWA